MAQMASISFKIFFVRPELVGNNNGTLRAKSINFKGLVSLLSWRNYYCEIQNRKEKIQVNVQVASEWKINEYRVLEP